MSGLLALVMIAVGLAQQSRQEVDPGGPPVAQVRAGLAAAALTSLADAVGRRDEDDVDALAGGDRLSYVVPNARLLGVRDFTLRYVDEVGAARADGSWLAEVDASWRFTGFDQRPARVQLQVELRSDGGDVLVTQLGGGGSGGTRAPLWLSAQVAVARVDDALVVVDAGLEDSSEAARAIMGEVRRAIATVRGTLPGWRGRVVVEQPGTAAGIDRALGAQAGTYAAVAGVTAPVDGSSSADAPVHVYLNPDVRARMDREGREVVLAHELTHVAVGASRSVVEPWLLEGFADYVALRDSGLPDRQTLARAITDARRNGVPRALPSADDFATDAGDLQLAYEHAWLACRLLADRVGTEGLVGLYRRADSGVPLDRVLADAGVDRAALLDEWRSALRGLVS